MRTMSLLVVSLLLATAHPQVPAPPSSPGPSATASSSKVWVGRYQEYEDFLRTVEIDRTEGFKVGVTGHTRHAFFKPGGLAPEGAVRDQQPGRYDGYFESYMHEAAAYRLDRLLELDMVPPTVQRQYNNRPVTLQLVIMDVRLLKEILAQKVHAPDGSKWNYQLHRAYMFDDLVANIDENETNMMFDPDWNLIKIDCSRCFTDSRLQPFEIGKRFTQIDRPFFDRIKALDRTVVKQQIGELVQGGSVDALMGRRDEIVKAFEKLAQQKGAQSVFGP